MLQNKGVKLNGSQKCLFLNDRFFDGDESVPATLCGSYKPDDPNDRDGRFYFAENRSCVLCEDEGIQVYGLNCGHLFCESCWSNYVHQKVVADQTK